MKTEIEPYKSDDTFGVRGTVDGPKVNHTAVRNA